jgi:hypothetical protein
MNIINTRKRRLLRGTLLKWDEKAGYHDRDGVKPALGPYYVVDLARGYQHWKNQTLIDEIVEQPDNPLPDLNELNAAIPRSEWELGLNGQPREPWQLAYAIVLFSPDRGEFFTLLNSTVGMKILWENFQERWEVMKALRGIDVLALVELSTRPFKTSQWGFKPRPNLNVLGWHRAEGKANEILFKPSQPQLSLPADNTTAQLTAQPTAQPTAQSPTQPTAQSPAQPPTQQQNAQQNAQPTSQPVSQPASQSASQPMSRPPQGQVTFLPPVKPVTRSEEFKDEIPW